MGEQCSVAHSSSGHQSQTSTAGLLGHQEQPGAQHPLGFEMDENNNTAAITVRLKLQNGVRAAEERCPFG